jgi:thiamine biosynthesis lipoprotein
MWREEFRAMGTSISVLLPRQRRVQGLQIVQTLFSQWEERLSRFLPDSELSQLNQRTGQPVVVSELFYQVLTAALEAAQATQGVYDPTLHDQLVKLGYDRTFEEIAALQYEKFSVVMPGGHWREIQINHRKREVTLPEGVRLDFGGIAKGMAVDAALTHLRRRGITQAMVNAGGDLGVLGQPPDAAVWSLAVQGRETFWTIPLAQGAMATSGIDKRRWQQGPTLRHHLLDPRTGLPTQGDLWSVTVVANYCEQAEIAAKVAFILGARQGAAFLRRHNLAGLLVREDGYWESVNSWPVHVMKGA